MKINLCVMAFIAVSACKRTGTPKSSDEFVDAARVVALDQGVLERSTWPEERIDKYLDQHRNRVNLSRVVADFGPAARRVEDDGKIKLLYLYSDRYEPLNPGASQLSEVEFVFSGDLLKQINKTWQAW